MSQLFESSIVVLATCNVVGCPFLNLFHFQIPTSFVQTHVIPDMLKTYIQFVSTEP